jgi:hypothetical protein
MTVEDLHLTLATNATLLSVVERLQPFHNVSVRWLEKRAVCSCIRPLCTPGYVLYLSAILYIAAWRALEVHFLYCYLPASLSQYAQQIIRWIRSLLFCAITTVFHSFSFCDCFEALNMIKLLTQLTLQTAPPSSQLYSFVSLSGSPDMSLRIASVAPSM